jgi:hypothetical protein
VTCDDCDKPAEYQVGRTHYVCERCLGFTIAELLPDPDNTTKMIGVSRVKRDRTRREEEQEPDRPARRRRAGR